MVRNLLAASVVAASFLSSTSLSRSADIQAAPEVATGPNWTGFYLGVHGGGAFGDMGYEIPNASYRFGVEDFAYGVHGGFDYQLNSRWVAGLELDYTQLNSKFEPFKAGGLGTLVEAKSSYAASARLGYLFTPETLVYGRLGYAGISIEAEEGFFETASKTVGSVLVGVGAETFVASNVTGWVEANYYHSTSDFTINDGDDTFDPRYLLVTAGLSYRFGAQNGSTHPAEAAPAMERNGFYAGAEGSFSLGVMHLDVDVPGATVGPYGTQTAGAGIFAGYDFVVGSSYLLGVEAGATYLDARFEDPSQNSGDPTAPTLFGTVKAAVSLTARAGYIATPSTLLYVKGGFAGLFAEANEDFFALDGGGSKMLSAYQVGAGVETAVTENVSLRVEGLYTRAIDDLVVTNSQTEQNALKPSLLTGKIGLAYRF